MARTISKAQQAKMAEGRRAKAQARVAAQQAQLKRDAEEIDDHIAKARAAYDESLRKAGRATTAAEIQKTFDASDRAMNTLLGLLRQKRRLSGLTS